MHPSNPQRRCSKSALVTSTLYKTNIHLKLYVTYWRMLSLLQILGGFPLTLAMFANLLKA